ncbi:MAG: hypothetical protein HYV63_16950 [Candidatus Schekmanbacteria bacterium]|nr:hypothetical protein [Candidatus Schekmanbacteria bacterium]
MQTSGWDGAAALTADPLRIPVLALASLVEAGHLEVNAASPFGFLLVAESRSTLAQRQKAAKELSALGVELRVPERTPGGPEPAAQSRMFRRGLEILAQPQARLGVAITRPGEEPVVATMFVRDGEAALGALDDEAAYVGPPVRLADLLERLGEQLGGPTRAPEPPGIMAWPSQVRFAAALWPGSGRTARDDLSADQAATRLTSLGLSASAARAVIGLLVESGFVEQRSNGLLRVGAPYAPWMEAMWSGHAIEVEATPLPPGAAADLGGVPLRSRRLLFVGAPGARVLCERLGLEQLRRELGELAARAAEGGDEAMIAFTIVPPAAVMAEIAGVIAESRPGKN